MAAEFSQKISSIQSDLNKLVQSINQVDDKVRKATQEFERMADQADDIQTLTSAVGQLNRLLSSEKSPLLDRLRGQVELVANELRKLDDKSVQRATKSLEAQAEAMSTLASASRRIGTALESTSRGLASLTTALDAVKESDAATTLKSVSDALSSINSLTNVKSVLSSINTVKGDNIASVTASLKALREELAALQKVGEVKVNVAQQAQRTRSKAQDDSVAKAADDTRSDVLKPNVTDSAAQADTTTATNKIQKRAQALIKFNNAIEAIEAAQVKLLEQLVSDAGQSDKFELAKDALIRRVSSQEHNQYLQEFQQDNPKAAIIEKLFNAKKSQINVPTGLNVGDEFSEVNLSDQKLISTLYRLRAEAQKEADALKQATQGDQVQASVLSNLQSFSTNIYRPISYGVTEFGAFLNGVMETLRGVKVGGFEGYLNALGGVFKSLHALNNAGSYFGVPLLPAGLGSIFNKKRSDTLLDIGETVLGLTRGGSRTGDEKRVRELEYQERQTVRQRDSIKETLNDTGLSDENKARLQGELSQVNDELKKLRATIRGYNEVLKDQIEREQEQGKSPLSSTGKELTQNSVIGTATQAAYEQQMSFAQSKLADILNRTNYLSPRAFANEYANYKGNSGVTNADRVGGFNHPTRGTFVNTSFAPEVQQGVAYHEAFHALLQDSSRFADNKQLSFRDAELESLRRQALSGYNNVKPSNTGDLFADSARANARNNPNYAFEATEIYANVGQSILSGNRKLQTALKEIYGDKLFDKIVADLKSADPAAFVHLDSSRAAQQIAQPAEALFDKVLAQIRQLLGPTYDVLADMFKQAFAGIQQLFGGQAGQLGNVQALVLNGGIGGGAGGGNIAQLLGQVFNPSSPSFARIAESINDNLVPKRYRDLTSAITTQGGGNFLVATQQALANPSQQSFANVAQAGKNLDLRNIAIQYVRNLFSSIELPGGLVGELIRQTGVPNKIAQSGINFAIDKIAQSAGPNAQTGRAVGFLARTFVPALSGEDTDFRNELNARVRKLTGRNIQEGSYDQQSHFNPTTGMTTFALQARTADGAVVQLNAHLDEFGRKKIEDPGNISQFKQAIEEFGRAIPRNLGYRFTEVITTSIDQMLHKLISVQDELGEVANLFGKVGDAASQVKADFLYQSVQTAVNTGQGFDEALQTNIKNFKVLGNVPNQELRQQLANQVSSVQLGAQTAFGLPLDQSLEAIPAILAAIRNGMDDITDPAEKVTKSVSALRDIMDQVVVAQRATGAQGDELITVYSRLAESAKEYGLNSKQLLGITAASSVALGRGSEETSNTLRSFLEGTYSEANQSSFAKAGIATKVFDSGTNRLENRSFEDILRDLYKLSENKDQSIAYNQLLQSIAGPKLKPQIGQIVQGFGRNYDFTEQALGQTQQGAFGQLVGQKAENISGALNKLQAAGTQFFGSFLVGTGILDKVTTFLNRLADTALKLTKLFNDNSGAIKNIFNVITGFLGRNIIGAFAKDFNLLTPIFGIVNSGKKAISATAQEFLDLVKGAESGGNRLAKSLTVIGRIFNEMEAAATGATGAVVGGLGQMATAATRTQGIGGGNINPLILSGAGGATDEEVEAMRKFLQREETVQASVLATGSTPGNKGTGILSFLGAAATEAGKGVIPTFRKNAALVGDVAGSVAVPAAFDVITGGIGKDNLINTAGAALAGTFLGAITASPQVGIVGYTMAKSFLENIDFSGLFGTSEKESGSFADALRTAIYGPKKNEPGQSPDDLKKEVLNNVPDIKLLTDKLGVNQLINYTSGLSNNANVGGVTASAALYSVSSEDVLRYQRRQNGQGTFLDNIRSPFGLGDAQVRGAISLFSGNGKLLDLFTSAGVSNVKEFLDLLGQASEGLGPLADDFAKLSAEEKKSIQLTAEQNHQQELQAQYQSAQDIINATHQRLTDIQKDQTDRYSVPYGLDTYNALSPKYAQFAIDAEGKAQGLQGPGGTYTQQNAQLASSYLEQLQRSQESFTQIPQTLQQLIPLARSTGQSTTGLEQRLYNIGGQGQQQLLQRFAPAIEASKFVENYQAQQANLRQLINSAPYKAGQAEALKEVDAVQKALAADKARYNINAAFLELLKGQSNALLDQAGAIEKQNQTRQLISAGTAGTPAQFTPASIFDTKGTTAAQLNSAIAYAVQKQNKLAALNPEYRKEFAKDQFLLQSGTDFKGVTGVDQGFVQEYLQQQKQQSQAPLEDLSKLSDQELKSTLERARSLQAQAVKLDPSREGKYDNERILILRKNNEILSQVGLGQEFLKAALDQNTKANDELRGHFNLPSNYKAPTVFDYYASGGTEKGDKNFPTLANQGLVPLSFAQQLAQELINPDNGDKSANLGDVKGTSQPGARPLFYPTPGTPGTPAIYSDVAPAILPDTIKSDNNLRTVSQRFMDFKDRQAQDLLDAGTILGSGKDLNKRADTRQGDLNPPIHYNSPQYTSKGSIGQSAPATSIPIQPDAVGLLAPPIILGKSNNFDNNVDKVYRPPQTRDTYKGERGGGYTASVPTDINRTFARLKDDAANTGTGLNTAKEAAIGLISPLKQTAEAGRALGAAIPTAVTSLNTGANAFASTISLIQQKLSSLDVNNIFRQQNAISMTVYVNGQPAQGQVNVQVNSNAGSGGTSALQAGSGTKSGSRGV